MDTSRFFQALGAESVPACAGGRSVVWPDDPFGPEDCSGGEHWRRAAAECGREHDRPDRSSTGRDRNSDRCKTDCRKRGILACEEERDRRQRSGSACVSGRLDNGSDSCQFKRAIAVTGLVWLSHWDPASDMAGSLSIL